jgi:hypothetical protein
VHPLRNRKGGNGNPPPTVGAPELYPNGTKAKAGHRPRRTWSHHLQYFGGQGVHREVESEGHEEKDRAVIEGATPQMNWSAKGGTRSSLVRRDKPA